jgi:hypothetical protein
MGPRGRGFQPLEEDTAKMAVAPTPAGLIALWLAGRIGSPYGMA